MSDKKPMISVVITSYNDAGIILPYFEAIHTFLSSQSNYTWELVYIDDGSIDNSVELLQELACQHSFVTVIELSCNGGQQKAQFCALGECRGDIMITLDGDYQYPPEVIVQLADKLMEGYDLVSGVRVKRKDPIWFKFSGLGNRIIRNMMGKDISDFGAVKAFSRFLVDAIISKGTVAMNVYGFAYNLTNKYCEIPVKHLTRYSGESKWSLWARVEFYAELFILFGQVNFKFVVLLALAMISIGGGYLTFAMVSKFVFGHFVSSGDGSMVLMMTGVLILFITLSTNMILKIFKTVSKTNPTVMRSKTKQ
jgi:undecaprenyl-phosphate 4-deoxy-4-formamido-L-arabinose transferase